ncbi:hypothetical protein Cgig2_033808 [Carnegiea gigantea]|uniref:Uncharacterized protein n=1 Tax=Carnegiea gigantea TaxID=171969 RepID=A0A9Q1K9Q7_9CARY|nr:hypothetical protein Cgig2_033808 [Carnegiea gigantea]
MGGVEATTVGPRLCCCQTTTTGHQLATQKPPRRVPAPTSFLPLLYVGNKRMRTSSSAGGRVPGVVIGGLPEVRWTLGLQEPPAAPSPVVVFGFDGSPFGFLQICASVEGVGIFRSRFRVSRKFLSPPASSVAVTGRQRTFQPSESRRKFSQPSFLARNQLFCSLALWFPTSHGMARLKYATVKEVVSWNGGTFLRNNSYSEVYLEILFVLIFFPCYLLLFVGKQTLQKLRAKVFEVASSGENFCSFSIGSIGQCHLCCLLVCEATRLILMDRSGYSGKSTGNCLCSYFMFACFGTELHEETI